MKTRRLNLKLVDCGTCCLLMLCPKVIFWFRVWYSQLGAAAWPSIFCLPNIHGKTDFPGSHKKKKSKGAYAVARGGENDQSTRKETAHGLMLDTQYVLWSFYRSLSHAYMHTRAHAHRHSLAGWINPCFQAPLSGWPVVLWFCHAAPLLFYSNDHASASFFFSLNFKGRRLELIHKWSVKWTPDTWSIGRNFFF